MKQFIEQITLEEMESEIKREIKMRERVYPRWVENGKMSKHEADLQILIMRACLSFLQNELKKNHAQGDLFK